MIDAIIAGRLYGAPIARTSNAGRPFATRKLRVPTANGETAFVNAIAFDLPPWPCSWRCRMATAPHSRAS